MEQENRKFNIGLTAAIVVIALLAGAVAYLFKTVRERDKSLEDMTQIFELEKQEMESEYSGFAVQYDELQVHLSNDSLIHQLEKEKMRTQQLLEELRQTKATNTAEITRLKKELATVRAVLKSYVSQIDSLDRVNKQLAQENTQVKQQVTKVTQEVEKLTVEKQIAEEKVALASQLDAVAITLTAGNKRGKAELKVKNVTHFLLDFTIARNITVQTGEKTVYMRLAKPDGEVLVSADSGKFPYENTSLDFTAKKVIEYTGEQQQVTIFWNVDQYLPAGTYTAYIFAEGVMIGQQSLELK